MALLCAVNDLPGVGGGSGCSHIAWNRWVAVPGVFVKMEIFTSMVALFGFLMAQRLALGPATGTRRRRAGRAEGPTTCVVLAGRS